MFITGNYERQNENLGRKGYRWNKHHPYIIPGFWSGDIFSSSLYHPWPFFIAHANRVVIAKIIKKNRKTYRDSFFIYSASGFGVLG